MPVVRPHRHRSGAVAVALFVALGLAGCNDAEEPEAVPSIPVVTTTAPEPGKPATVRMIDAGAAPRRVIALEVEKGHTESSTLDLTSTTAGDFTESTTVPRTLPFTTTVVEVTDDEVTTDVVYGKPTVDGGSLDKDLLEQARKTMAYLEGVTVRIAQNRAGTVLSRDVRAGDAPTDLVGRILEDVVGQGFALTVAFPADEIGVGAVWQVDHAISVGGSTVQVVTMYELTELTESGYTVQVISGQTAEPGNTLAGKVVDGTSESTATVRGRVDLVGPVNATAKTNGSTTVEVGGQRVRTTFDMTMDVSTR